MQRYMMCGLSLGSVYRPVNEPSSQLFKPFRGPKRNIFHSHSMTQVEDGAQDSGLEDLSSDPSQSIARIVIPGPPLLL